MEIYRTNYELASWLPIELISSVDLSINPNALDFLIQNPQYIDWDALSGNPNATLVKKLVFLSENKSQGGGRKHINKQRSIRRKVYSKKTRRIHKYSK